MKEKITKKKFEKRLNKFLKKFDVVDEDPILDVVAMLTLEKGRWWSVLDANGSLLMETSNSEEAVACHRENSGSRLQNLHRAEVEEWIDMAADREVLRDN